MLTHDKEYIIFNYTFEVIINQVFEEYLFIKNILKRLEDEIRNIKDEEWLVDFLYFYENFTWKNKKMNTMYDKFNWYFKHHLIRFPSLFFFEDKSAEYLNNKLIKYRPQVDKKKHEINNMVSYEELSVKAKEFFQLISKEKKGTEKDWLLFSRNSILNKLEVDVMQKRTSLQNINTETENSLEEVDEMKEYEEEENMQS